MNRDPDPTRIVLEVCIASLRDAVTAARAGARRVELNSALELGGLTPSPALTELVVESAQSHGCRVIAMVRPRPGGFDYDDDELRVMRRNIEYLLKLGVDGVVFGVLHAGGSVDPRSCRELIGPVQDAGREAVFHRAFDLTPDPSEALEKLIDVGFARVLTSGQRDSALAGADTIQRLIRQSAGRIEVLPGGGIRPGNVAELIERTGATQVHASLRSLQPDASTASNPGLRFSSTPPNESQFGATDGALVTEMLRALGGG